MKPMISVGALGGTICMSAKNSGGGVKPSFSAEQLLEAVPKLSNLANFRAKTLFALASGSLKVENLIEVYHWAKKEVENGADGVVITQGTDSLEESAFLLNLLWDEQKPLVITGAMRNPDQISSDGAGNIYASVLTALDKNSHNRGVLVVFNNTIHSARWVHKSNTFALETFVSINAGIQGVIAEDEVKYINLASKRVIFKAPSGVLPKVSIVTSYMGECGCELKLLEDAKFNGVVIASFGAGHVSIDSMKVIESLKFPVVISSRTGSGVIAKKTYGYYGSEITLQESGCIMSGWLNPLQSRLLLIVLLANGKSKAEILETFDKI
ncbi:asparaginase [Campylobacter geochelonis]|uniref:asparaginase n=1 Tax=Campylobacter geochelonis TaxID=1780362 RepID=UPI000770ACA8|nr:asparaginase [Campylobacter geochelonis]CZE47445.1 L-asparaginase II [Campylobacter geochelonis]